MSYLLFLAILALSALVFGLMRLFGSRVSFETVITTIGIGVVMCPVVVMSLLLCLCIAVALIMVATVALQAAGLYPIVASLGLWKVLPTWAWFAVGTVAVGVAFHVHAWRKNVCRKDGAFGKPRTAVRSFNR